MLNLQVRLRNVIPKHCFESNALTSLRYMAVDLMMFSTLIWTYPGSDANILTLLLYWNIYGFLGWCIFVIGHDCGHGSFSKYPLLNAVAGNVCHGILLVPYYPWARSHHLHHRYHNHKSKDRSHPWKTNEEFQRGAYLLRLLLPTLLGPFLGFWIYLIIGSRIDGSHFVWFGQLYRGASKREKIKCFVSTVVVFAWIFLVYSATGSWLEFWTQYGLVIAFTYFWLFMVTWFQHHDENTLVYSDEDWNFMKGALQTVDRKIGYGIDKLHHHISDCHIAHHMFFTSVPHYHLREATDAIYRFADAQEIDNFKRRDHSQFPLKYVYDFLQLYPKIHATGWSWGK